MARAYGILRIVSARDLETVRRIYEALGRDELDAAFRFMAPEIEYVNPEYAVDSGTRHGYRGIRENIENMRSAFEHWRFEPDEFVDAGGMVIVVGTFDAKGRTGVRMQRRMSRLWTMEGGLAVRYEWFDNEAEAFQVAGLEEEARSRQGRG